MSTEHIHDRQEAVEKLMRLVKDIDFCIFCTDLASTPIESSPMSTQEVDEDGNCWFLASKDSTKYRNIHKDPHVQLFYAAPGDFKYLTVYGRAEALYDRRRIEKYWNKFVEGWFEKGIDDPNIILLKVNPEEAHYWDTKSNKMIAYAKTLFSAFTGAKNDEGREGELKV
ncbi:pyridoxamine 5'-phosphate oxidase family protein [Parapedobacter koreensis]|uniref:General stress protein 26 n=1 Tax=Parapedobacter koreensis TaxID=332977 RepID=A0A1H7EUV4_9SPHI|nr:pyridoxamine 5'-phosphate oxidase family protein [Parapedobacter koreensis]SEK17683.1 General stress protein 26 [Parapedobacter koreensis]